MGSEPIYRPGVPIHLDDLVRVCGHFESETGVNNGYGCTHPEQEEQQPGEGGKPHGSCFAHSCPVACALHPEDEAEDKAILNAAFGASPVSEWSNDGWMLPYEGADDGR